MDFTANTFANSDGSKQCHSKPTLQEQEQSKKITYIRGTSLTLHIYFWSTETPPYYGWSHYFWM